MDSIVYNKIEEVIKKAGKPLAEFEFDDVVMFVPVPGDGDPLNGRKYVGCSQSTLGRRMREMREQGRLVSNKRSGKQFVEYDLAFTGPSAEPPCPI